MGIRLDWQVEADDGSEEVAEDAAALAAQHHKRLLVRRLLLILTPILIAGSLLVWWRLRINAEARYEALMAVVEAETLALRVGDQSKFLKFQSANDDWRVYQNRNFVAFQAHVPVITMTDEIIDVEVHGTEARVTVKVLVGDLQEVAVWLYAYSQDKGWQHVSTEAEPWVRTSMNGAGYRIEYYQSDEDLAQQLDAFMSEWWNDVTRLSGIDDPLPLIAVLDPYSDTVIWADEAQTKLTIPTADSQDGLLNVETMQVVRLTLADRWADYLLGSPQLTADEGWVITETSRWVLDTFNPGQPDGPSADVFFALSGAFGHRFLPGFFAAMRADPLSVRATLQEAMTAHGPYAGRTDGLNRYLSYAIRAEIAFHNAYEVTDQNTNDGPAPMTRDLFLFEQRSTWAAASGGKLPYEGVDPESVQILAVEEFPFTDLLWVTASMQRNGEAVAVRVPFIFKNNYWIHTWATERDWGARTRTGNLPFYPDGSTPNFGLISLEYHALDEAYFNGDTLEFLNSIAAQAEADLGLQPQALDVYVGPGQPRMVMFQIHGEWVGNLGLKTNSVFQSTILSPDESPSDHYAKALSAEIVVALYRSIKEKESTHSDMTALDHAIVQWEMRHLGVEGVYTGKPYPTDYFPLSRIEEIYMQRQFLQAGDWSSFVGAEVMVEMLMERYGTEKLPAMIRNQDGWGSLDDWLFYTFRIRAHELQDEWYERYRQRLEEYEQHTP